MVFVPGPVEGFVWYSRWGWLLRSLLMMVEEKCSEEQLKRGHFHVDQL